MINIPILCIAYVMHRNRNIDVPILYSICIAMTYNRKTNAEDLGVIWLTIWAFSLILLLVGIVYYPIVWFGLVGFITSMAVIILAILFRNRL